MLIKIVRAGVSWFERCETWLGYVAGFTLVLMGVATSYEVVVRFVFHAPTLWSMELNMNLLLYFAFLGGAYTLLSGGHVRVDILYDRFPPRKKAAIDAVTFMLVLLFIIVLIWKGLEMALFSLKVGKTSGGAMAWPLFPLQIMIPIGALLVGLQMIIQILRNIQFVFKTLSTSRTGNSDDKI